MCGHKVATYGIPTFCNEFALRNEVMETRR